MLSIILFKVNKIGEVQASIYGQAMMKIIDFSAKELVRLQEERKITLMSLLAEKDRCKREALEAGRRQVELRRRRQHEDMYKQVYFPKV